MPVVQKKVTLAAAAVNDNLMSGSQFEFLPYDARLEFGINGDANAADVRIDVYSGQDVLMEDAQPSVQARIPIYPDDFQLVDVAAGGERIKIRARNLHATLTRDVYISVRITPI